MKFRSLLSTILILNIFFLVNSCSKEMPVETDEAMIVDDFRMMTVAYYRDSEDGNSIGVRFYETPRIINLPKTAENYAAIKKLLDESRDKKTPIAIELKDITDINAARIPTPHELGIYNDIIHKPIDNLETEIFKKVISMDELNEIFAYMAAQGCATGTAEIDYCIPFQYVVDGCYARAHKMRQVLQNKYGVNCEKVFSYEGASGSLAVDAGDCCVFWWYHVAPLVSVSTVFGVQKFVMDPSMFDHPVTIQEWTTAQENTDCTAWADFGHFEITEGWCYSPGYYGDDDYSSTNWTLQWYADLETCD